MPKVSIVMPVYNGEAYIKAAIDSIIAQTFTDWEFIIINEYGSNEAVTQILREYEEQDNRIHVIQNETRLRIAESLNVGLRAAKGEYIARMDADDISGKDRLLNQVQYLDEHQEIDICGMKVDMFGETTWDWKVYSDPEYLRCSCLFYTPFIHPTIMMRTSSIRKYNLEYDKTFFYTEDYEFFERASHVLNYTNLEIPQNYHYRYLSTNATNVGGNQGLQLQNKVMKSAFQRWGLEFTDDEIRILSPNTYPYAQSVEQAQDILERLDLLLKEVFLSDALREKFGIDILYQVLHRRWMDAYEAVRWRSEIMDDGQMQRAIDRGFFRREKFYTPIKASVAPRVSVVIPTYNSERYVMDTLWSILEQDYTQFEVLIMNEYGSDDRTRKCVELFGDGRVQFIQNETKLGLAKSLNLGFRMAKGEYIARADADDIYSTDRLSKQVEFLDAHPEIDVCGTWQRHFGKRNYIHKPVTSKEEMRVNLIFKCDVCHSTVMLRRDKFVSLDVIYDDSYLSEDFELWSRVSPSMWFATIPEVLGEYRWNGNNITAQKMDMLDIEAQKLVRRNLYNTLGLVIPDEDLVLLSGWKNPFMDETKDVEQLRSREEELLTKIEKRNHEIGALDEKALSKFLYERKVWAGIQKAHMFRRTASSCEPKQNTGGVWRKMLKRIIKPLYRPFRTRYENRLIGIQESVWRHDGVLDGIEKTLHDMDGHLYDYHHKLELKIEQQGAYIDQLQALIKGMTEELKSIRNQIVASENTVVQAMDGRIWQAEKLINQTTDTRVWNAEKLINQTLDGRIWEAEKLIKRTITDDISFYDSIVVAQITSKKKIFLIGTPEHPNIGDSAIAVGELEFIRQYFSGYYVVELTDRKFERYYSEMAYYIGQDDLIFLHGGGNIGERYMQHQNIRNRVIQDFPQNPITILPQTIYFESTEQGKKELERTKNIYSQHNNLTLFTRGMTSLEFARNHFPLVRSECALDLALFLKPRFEVERNGILACIRDLNDESGLSNEQYQRVFQIVEQYDPNFIKTNNIFQDDDKNIYSCIRSNVVECELKKFASHRVIVTDRLHGLIFAVITMTPCVLLRSYNQKIAEFYELLKDSNAIFYVDQNLDKIGEAIEQAMHVQNISYPEVNAAAFEDIYKTIQEGLNAHT